MPLDGLACHLGDTSGFTASVPGRLPWGRTTQQPGEATVTASEHLSGDHPMVSAHDAPLRS